jgi:hypothetical protein
VADRPEKMGARRNKSATPRVFSLSRRFGRVEERSIDRL